MPYKFKCTTDNTFNAAQSKDTTENQTNDIILRGVSLGVTIIFACIGAAIIYRNHK